MQKYLFICLLMVMLLTPCTNTQAAENALEECTLMKDRHYVIFGATCCLSALFIGIIMQDLRAGYKIFAKNARAQSYFPREARFKAQGDRWYSWYGEYAQEGALAEIIGSNIIAAGLGITGLYYLAKGLHLKDLIIPKQTRTISGENIDHEK